MQMRINSALGASILAAFALTASSVRAEPSMDRPLIQTGDGGGQKASPVAPAKPVAPPKARGDGERRAHRGGGLGFGGLGLDLGFAHIEDPATGYSQTCLYVGDCKASIVRNPGEPPQKKVEIRRKAPKPIRHVTDKRTGWTYYLAEDRDTGETFIQILDANGADVHINGAVPMPGGGPVYPVR